MAIHYRIMPSAQLAYVKASGNLTIEEILGGGASVFADEDWDNGFGILLDYREVTRMDIFEEDVRRLVAQDKRNEHMFDRSRCAIVAEEDFVYGMARMWETLSHETSIESKVFRDMDKAVDWLGLSPEILDSTGGHP